MTHMHATYSVLDGTGTLHIEPVAAGHVDTCAAGMTEAYGAPTHDTAGTLEVWTWRLPFAPESLRRAELRRWSCRAGYCALVEA